LFAPASVKLGDGLGMIQPVTFEENFILPLDVCWSNNFYHTAEELHIKEWQWYSAKETNSIMPTPSPNLTDGGAKPPKKVWNQDNVNPPIMYEGVVRF
jgi:hypothetical protein